MMRLRLSSRRRCKNDPTEVEVDLKKLYNSYQASQEQINCSVIVSGSKTFPTIEDIEQPIYETIIRTQGEKFLYIETKRIQRL